MLELTDETTSVPLRQAPVPGESILSFLTRTAEANWYERIRWFLQREFVQRWDIGIWPDARRTKIATLVGISSEEFDELCYRPHPRKARLEDQRYFLGNRVPSMMLDLARRKFCPACMEEDREHPAAFDLRAVTACPIHGCRLQSRCPHCRRETRWGGSSLRRCSDCSGDLADAFPVHIEGDELNCAAAIFRRAGYPLDSSTAGKWLDEANHLDLGTSIELLTILSRLAAHDVNAVIVRESHSQLDRVWPGYSLIVDWPTRFFNCLDRIALGMRATPPRLRKRLFGFSRAFGEFYEQLTIQRWEPWLFLKMSFATYAAQQEVVPVVGRSDGSVCTAEDIAQRPLITPAEAQEFLGRKYYSMKSLIDAGAIDTVQVGGARKRVFVRRADIEKLASGGAPVDKRAASEILGVPTVKLKQMLDGGAITPLVGPAVDGRTHYLFSKNFNLSSLVDMLRSKLEPDNNYPNNITMLTLLRGQETLHVSCRGVFEGISNGDLKVRGWDETRCGIAAAMFNNREVDRFIHFLHDRELGDTDGLTTLRVAHMFSMNPMTIYHFLEKGLLGNGLKWTRKRPRISRLSVEQFRQKYTTAAALARDFSTNAHRILSALSEMGITPAQSRGASKFQTIIFLRSDIDSIELKKRIRHGKMRQPDGDRKFPFLLSNRQMELISSAIPPPSNKPRMDDRVTLSGIIYAIINNVQWVNIPRIYGRSQALRSRLVRWSNEGIFDKILVILSTNDWPRDRVNITTHHLRQFPTTARLLRAGLFPSF